MVMFIVFILLSYSRSLPRAIGLWAPIDFAVNLSPVQMGCIEAFIALLAGMLFYAIFVSRRDG